MARDLSLLSHMPLSLRLYKLFFPIFSLQSLVFLSLLLCASVTSMDYGISPKFVCTPIPPEAHPSCYSPPSVPSGSAGSGSSDGTNWRGFMSEEAKSTILHLRESLVRQKETILDQRETIRELTAKLTRCENGYHSSGHHDDHHDDHHGSHHDDHHDSHHDNHHPSGYHSGDHHYYHGNHHTSSKFSNFSPEQTSKTLHTLKERLDNLQARNSSSSYSSSLRDLLQRKIHALEEQLHEYYHDHHDDHHDDYHDNHHDSHHDKHYDRHHDNHHDNHHTSYHDNHHYDNHHNNHHYDHHDSRHGFGHYTSNRGHHDDHHSSHHDNHHSGHHDDNHSGHHDSHHNTHHETHHSSHHNNHHDRHHDNHHGSHHDDHYSGHHDNHHSGHHDDHHGDNHHGHYDNHHGHHDTHHYDHHGSHGSHHSRHHNHYDDHHDNHHHDSHHNHHNSHHRNHHNNHHSNHHNDHHYDHHNDHNYRDHHHEYHRDYPGLHDNETNDLHDSDHYIFNKDQDKDIDHLGHQKLEDVLSRLHDTDHAAPLPKLSSPTAFLLDFPMRTNYMFGRMKRSVVKELFALTVCLWIKPGAGPGLGTPFSYAVPGQTNELVLIEWGNDPMQLLLNNKAVNLPVSLADGDWHHICVHWATRDGTWGVFQDGQRRGGGKDLSPWQAVKPGGVFILGQEQDDVGGHFDVTQSFMGQMSDLQFWSRVLTPAEIQSQASCTVHLEGDVLSWTQDAVELHGGLAELDHEPCH